MKPKQLAQKVENLVAAPYSLNQQEAESLATLKEREPQTFRAILKLLEGKELLEVRQFRNSKDTEAMLRTQGALQFLDKFRTAIEDIMEVLE